MCVHLGECKTRDVMCKRTHKGVLKRTRAHALTSSNKSIHTHFLSPNTYIHTHTHKHTQVNDKLLGTQEALLGSGASAHDDTQEGAQARAAASAAAAAAGVCVCVCVSAEVCTRMSMVCVCVCLLMNISFMFVRLWVWLWCWGECGYGCVWLCVCVCAGVCGCERVCCK